MSIWISRAAALAALLALAACVPGIEGGSGGGGPNLSFGSAKAVMPVLGAGLIVAGPRGYCVDRAASRDSAEAAFVLLGSCAAIARSPLAPSPPVPVILTASVIPGGTDISAQLEPLAAFFRSEGGRAALSRSGEAATVEIVDIFDRDGALFILAADTSEAGSGAVVEAEYWRVILALNGHIVTLSSMGLRDRPLSREDKRAALEAFLLRLRAANPPPVAD